jgi:hypothetical protein
MTRIIELIISPKGETTLRTRGYAGSECLEASRYLEEGLGTAIDERKTAAFHQTPAAREELREPSADSR